MNRSSDELTELAEQYVHKVERSGVTKPRRTPQQTEEAVRATRTVLARLQGGTSTDSFLLEEYRSLRGEVSRRFEAQDRISLTTLIGAAPLLVIGASAPIRTALAALGVLIALTALASLLWQYHSVAVTYLAEYLTLMEVRFAKNWGWERYMSGAGPVGARTRSVPGLPVSRLMPVPGLIFVAIQVCAILVAVVRFVTTPLSKWDVGDLSGGFAVGLALALYAYWIGETVQPRSESALLRSLAVDLSEPDEESEKEERSTIWVD